MAVLTESQAPTNAHSLPVDHTIDTHY